MSGKPSQATELVGLADDIYLFHDASHVPYAQIDMGSHVEVWPLREKMFRRFLSRRYYSRYGKAPGSQAVQDALGVLEGRALFEGVKRDVYVRVARGPEVIFLDLGNDRWQCVEITQEGWRVMPGDLPVSFRRPRGLLPLPAPVKGGHLADLRQFVNVVDEDWALILAWLVGALGPGPYAVLDLIGLQGSAKSTTARVLRSLIDPNIAALRSEPREVRDLMIAASNGLVVSWDNLSRLPPWLSDAICRLATGGGFSTRELYSDSDEIIFEAQRPVILNGIEQRATRGDLLDRSLLVSLPEIREEDRRPEARFWKAFETARPRILGALLDAVVVALRRVDQVELTRLPRMADFARWAVAAESAFGVESGSFLRAYDRNRDRADEIVLEANPIAEMIAALVPESGEWSGTASELLDALNGGADDDTRRAKDWPKSPVVMGNVIRRIAPSLRSVQITVRPERSAGKRVITLERAGRRPSLLSQLAAEHDGHDGHDGDDSSSHTQSNESSSEQVLA